MYYWTLNEREEVKGNPTDTQTTPTPNYHSGDDLSPEAYTHVRDVRHRGNPVELRRPLAISCQAPGRESRWRRDPCCSPS